VTKINDFEEKKLLEHANPPVPLLAVWGVCLSAPPQVG